MHKNNARLWIPGLIAGLATLGFAGQSSAHMEIGGHLNVIASQSDTEDMSGNSDTVSDVNVSSLEVGLVAGPTRHADVNVVWLLEEEPGGGSPDQGFAVDQAFLTLSGTGRMLSERPDRENMEDSPLYLQAGKMYIPFAINLEYHTFDVISEPETLGMGETLESALLVGYSPTGVAHVYGGIYGGRGADEGTDDDLNDYILGLNAEFDPAGFVVQWTNNINNSITLIDELDANEEANAGLTVNGHASLGPATFQISYVTAQDEYAIGDFANQQPSAWNTEITFDGLNLGSREWAVTGLYGQTDEWYDHPESTAGLVVDTSISDAITFSFEYLHREYDNKLSSGADQEDLFAVRLSTEFSEMLGGLMGN